MTKRVLCLTAAMALLSMGYLAGSVSRQVTQAQPGAQQGNCQTFRETGKSVCGRFLNYWVQHGGVAQQGFPISQEFTEKSDLNGQTYTVQYFERAVFEYHSENQPPYDVLLSQLGAFRYKNKYGSAGPTPVVAIPTPTLAPTRPIFVGIGDDARRNGMVFTVTRVDRPTKRIDVIYGLRNETGSAISFTIDNANQHLVDSAGREYPQSEPTHVANVTIQNGETYNGGTSFSVTSVSKGTTDLTFAIDNLPRIGGVRVRVPLQEEP